MKDPRHDLECIKCNALKKRNGKVCCRWCCKEEHSHIDCSDDSRCHCDCHNSADRCKHKKLRHDVKAAVCTDCGIVVGTATPKVRHKRGCGCGCGGNNQYCDTHFCSEICKDYNGTRPKIQVVASPRIDFCGACKKEHGYDCPLAWQDEEREEFREFKRTLSAKGLEQNIQRDSLIETYWLSRIEKIREQAFLEADSFYRSRKDEWDIETRRREREDIRAMVKGLDYTDYILEDIIDQIDAQTWRT